MSGAQESGGEVNVVEEMERLGSPVGGEGNGGVIYPACHSGRDSGVANGRGGFHAAEQPRNHPFSLGRGFPRFSMIKTKVPFAGPSGASRKP
jgi:phosphomannomutase